MKKIFYFLTIIGLLSFGLSSQTNAAEPQSIGTSKAFGGGEWQTIVDGQAGEGALFYRFEFNADGTVWIEKQCGGSDNIRELKHWDQVVDRIVLTSRQKENIHEFDGAKLIITDEETMRYENAPYKGVVKPYKQGLAFAHWVLILVVLVLLNELFRRYKWANWAFFLILPIILTPLVWSQHEVTYWFKWVKVYSVIFAVLWFNLIRYTKLNNRMWVKLIAALFLAINIAEAVSQDFSMGYWPNILNGLAGALNIITLFYGWKKIGPDKSKEKDMVWMDMPVLWIIAYDVWNLVYVYLNFPGSTSAQFMVILACTIPALFIKKGTWLQARGFTLAVWFMYYFTFPRFTEQLELFVPRSMALMWFMGALSLALNILYAVIFIKSITKEKRKKEQTDQVLA